MTVTGSELPGASLARTAVCGPIPSTASRGDADGDAAALAPQADAIAPKKRASQSRADTTVPPQATRRSGRSEQVNAFQRAERQVSKHLARVRCSRTGERICGWGVGMGTETRGYNPAKET